MNQAAPTTTAEELTTRLAEVAERLGTKSPTRAGFMRETGITESQIDRHFDNWGDVLEAAGLDPPLNARRTDEQLFDAMRDALAEAGGICSQLRFNRLCRHGIRAYQRRFGTWRRSLAHFREWALTHAPDFAYLDQLPTLAVALTEPVRRGRRPKPKTPSTPGEPGAAPAWPAKGGRLYGPLVNFRGWMHAPLNECGVVLLFGMVARELGYVVESVTAGFPDCEAKRRVDEPRDVWERVRIEFEYESRNFALHGHDAAGCELIVCWRHNWPGCPLEVLELEKVLPSLAG